MAKKYTGPRVEIAIAEAPFEFLDQQYDAGDEVAIVPPWTVDEAATDRLRANDPSNVGIVVSSPEELEETYSTRGGEKTVTGYRLISPGVNQILPITFGMGMEPMVEPELVAAAPEDLTRSEVINAFGDKLGQKLLDAGYSSLSGLAAASDQDLLKIPGVGPKAISDIRAI